MIVYILRRLVYVTLIVITMSMLIFWATQIMPGNVAYMILGDFAAPEQVALVEERLGLNDPIWVQYARWASGILEGDLGDSMIMQRPIGPLLFDALRNSAVLATLAIVLVTISGIWLGVFSAIHNGRPADHVVSVTTYVVLAIPEFFWCIVVIMLFAGYLGWLPATGYASLSDGVWSWARHLILPVVTLVLGLIAHVSRLTRSSMLEVMQSRYILAARAKGLPERYLLRRHALPNALLPTITVLAIDVGVLMGGIVVVETVFSYPGLGRLLIFGIQQLDIPLIQACILVITIIYAVANLIADLLYAWFNPRIRYGSAVGG
jgi:peptide/nickel transport system permease protein